jgi:hypothetical protein|tara:strand:- start:5837 stop:6544 length:708 start_codon:yes stop_codon:yes gene_type:complete
MLTKKEIIRLYFGDDNSVLDPDFNWKVNVEAFGLNPENYIVDKKDSSLININELYNALLVEEVKVLKNSLSHYKDLVFGSNKLANYMIANSNFDFYGYPKNRDELYYMKKMAKSNLNEIKTKEYCKMFSQGDTIQPENTEHTIKQYANDEKVIPDLITVNKLTEWDITIHEWERAMIVKELLVLQKDLSKELINNNEIFITDLMPKKYLYGQNIVFNRSKNKYSKNGKWISIKNL